MKTLPNEPIHPIVEVLPSGTDIIEFGLTKREYFAAMAMQGKASSLERECASSVAQYAVEFADALIKELNK